MSQGKRFIGVSAGFEALGYEQVARYLIEGM
jgi:hypothetical protein